jgi:hypothetical protein
MSDFLFVDVATAPLPEAAEYLTEPIDAPGNYKDPEKIAAYIAEKRQQQLDKAALDPDLCRISGLGWMMANIPGAVPTIVTCQNADEEAEALRRLDSVMGVSTVLVGFNSRAFDWRVLNRRALYLDVPFMRISCDRYRSTHVDLLDKLTDNGTGPSHSLAFYVKRFGWDLVKPLNGAEESRVFESGDWEGLKASLLHDVTATARLALRLKAV